MTVWRGLFGEPMSRLWKYVLQNLYLDYENITSLNYVLGLQPISGGYLEISLVRMILLSTYKLQFECILFNILYCVVCDKSCVLCLA